MIRTVIKATMLMLAIGAAKPLLAQDSMQVVVLSTRVGAEINASQREYFKLFPSIEGFKSATVLKTLDDRFLVKFLVTGRNGKDTVRVLPYPFMTLRQMAEKINHFEELKAGEYEMGTDPAKLQVMGTVFVPQAAIVSKPAIQPKTEPEQPVLPLLLPFRNLEPPVDIRSFPRFRCGVGVSSFSPDLSGIDASITEIEQSYQSRGYSLPHQTAGLELSNITWFALGLDLSPELEVEINAGKADKDGKLTFKTASASLFYYFNSLSLAFVRPFVGVGIAHYRLSVNQEYLYGVRLTPNDQRGGYTELHSIMVSGQEKGTSGSFAFGFESYPSKGWMGVGIRLAAQFINPPKVSVASLGGKRELDMKRFVFGANIFFYF